jgi:hypothetical protein
MAALIASYLLDGGMKSIKKRKDRSRRADPVVVYSRVAMLGIRRTAP